VSMHATATSLMIWYLQCSSSTAASSLGSKEVGGDDDVGEGQNLLGESVHDTGATPTMSPNLAFECPEWQQQSAAELRLVAAIYIMYYRQVL